MMSDICIQQYVGGAIPSLKLKCIFVDVFNGDKCHSIVMVHGTCVSVSDL